MPDAGRPKHRRAGEPEELRLGFDSDDGDYEPVRRRRPALPAPARPAAPPVARPVEQPPVAQPPVQRAPDQNLARDSGSHDGDDMVFIPSEPIRDGATQAELQLRRMVDGRLAVLAYTSLDLLVAGCGAEQGWLAAPVEQLQNLQPLVGFDVIALNVELPDDWRVESDGYATSMEGTLQ